MLPATHKSLSAKLRQAIKAFDEGKVLFATETHVESDIEELGLEGLEDYKDLIYECLQLAQSDPLRSFRQPAPPRSTKHELTKNLPMWAFEVFHRNFCSSLYFKFCLKTQPNGIFYCHIDCHGSHSK